MADVLSKSDPHLLEPDRWQIECHPVRWHYVQKAYMPCASLDGGEAWRRSERFRSICGAAQCQMVVTASRSERAIRYEFLLYPIK
jgi:hypothetical protein